MTKEVESVRSSIVQFQIGNRTYNMVESRRCGVCMHPGRLQIEGRLLQNYGWTAVAKFVSDLNSQKVDGSVEDWYALTPAQIKNHYESGHCPEGNVSRALIEQRAKDRGVDLATATENYVDHVIVQQAVLARGYELLVKGEISPDVKDTLAAAKLLGDSQKEDESASTVEQWQEFMSIYFTAVQTIVSTDQWDEIVAAIQKHPVFQEMKATSTNDNDIQDAELVE